MTRTTLTRWHHLQRLTAYELVHGAAYRAGDLATLLAPYSPRVPVQRRGGMGD